MTDDEREYAKRYAEYLDRLTPVEFAQLGNRNILGAAAIAAVIVLVCAVFAVLRPDEAGWPVILIMAVLLSAPFMALDWYQNKRVIEAGARDGDE